MKIGYARVSTQDQNLGRQVSDLQKYGCEIIFTEKITGTKASRPELDKMIATLKEGDTVVIHKLDRLGRSLQHLISLVNNFKEKQVDLISLNDNFNTTTSQGKLIFNIMASIAEFERDLISERTISGLAYVKSQGRKLGRRFTDADKLSQVEELRSNGARISEIIKQTGLSRSTIDKHLKFVEYKNADLSERLK
ncbi:MAG TPA: recombinase family protein [Cyclobacteriaceae bacterium]|jgi:DNA invertase Pin-like site-specific DNA recombinase|nr:recombinase family protein [Cyclobacteriaceae bacterium]